MTLRELVRQAGGIDSPAMNYDLAVIFERNFAWTGEYKVIQKEIHHRIYLEISQKTLEMMLERK